MSKNFITRLFSSRKTEPVFLSDSRLCELNVDILWTRTTYLCATAYPCFKVSGCELQVTGYFTLDPDSMPFASSIICLNVCCFSSSFDLLILRTLNLGTHVLCRFGTSFQWRIRESNP